MPEPPNGRDMQIAAEVLRTESLVRPQDERSACRRVAEVLDELAPLADKLEAGDMAGAMADLARLQAEMSRSAVPSDTIPPVS